MIERVDCFGKPFQDVRASFRLAQLILCAPAHDLAPEIDESLQDLLQKAGVAHEFVTIPGGGHGNFPPDQWERAYAAIEKFLTAHVPAPKPTSVACVMDSGTMSFMVIGGR